jgi:hypothetical protein
MCHDGSKVLWPNGRGEGSLSGMTESFRPIYTITNPITAGLTHIERARGFLEAAALSETWVHRMERRALVLEAHHTTHAECP